MDQLTTRFEDTINRWQLVVERELREKRSSIRAAGSASAQSLDLENMRRSNRQLYSIEALFQYASATLRRMADRYGRAVEACQRQRQIYEVRVDTARRNYQIWPEEERWASYEFRRYLDSAAFVTDCRLTLNQIEPLLLRPRQWDDDELRPGESLEELMSLEPGEGIDEEDEELATPLDELARWLELCDTWLNGRDYPARDEERKRVILAGLDALSSEERRVLVLRFGFEHEPRAIWEIADELNLEATRVGELETTGLRRLAALSGVEDADLPSARKSINLGWHRGSNG